MAPRAGAEDEGGRECFAANDCEPGFACDALGRCQPFGEGGAEAEAEEGEPELPPETEIEVETDPPATGDRFVWVALPDGDAVARIDPGSLEVVAIPVGHRPEALRPVPGQDVVAVLNAGSDSVSIVRHAGGADAVTELPVLPANRLAMSPDGRHAVTWFSLGPDAGLPPSLQDVTVVRMEQEEAFPMSVGFRVRELEFTADGVRAFAITDYGISVLDLGAIDAAGIAELHELDREADPDQREVEVAPDGSFAFVRQAGAPSLLVVELATDDRFEVPLPAPPSDLDLLPSADLAVVVLRDLDAVALIDVPEDLGEPDRIEIVEMPGETVGSAVVTPDGRTALLFTNAVDHERVVALDLRTGAFQARLLEKSVRTLAPAPDSGAALALHGREPGDPAEPGLPADEVIDRSWGYTMIRIDPWFSKLQLAQADAGPLAFAPSGDRAFLTFADRERGVRAVHDVDLAAFQAREHPLGSPPAHVGVAARARTAFVSQEHPAGRITFFDLRDGATRTLTGFALNSEVVE